VEEIVEENSKSMGTFYESRYVHIYMYEVSELECHVVLFSNPPIKGCTLVKAKMYQRRISVVLQSRIGWAHALAAFHSYLETLSIQSGIFERATQARKQACGMSPELKEECYLHVDTHRNCYINKQYQ
jgi:hypothetical protein